MTESAEQPTARRRLHWQPLELSQRLTLLAWPAVFLAVLGIAFWLKPDPRGLGTHQQLGFPPCTTTLLFHVPCPFCGMTTAFSHMVHGHIKESFACQPAGALAFLLCAVSAVATLAFAATGRWPAALNGLLERKSLWAVTLILLAAAWVYKIAVTVAA